MRSRYFIAYLPWINIPSEANGQVEVSFRFFEGAGAGTVIIGIPPSTPTFKKLFDWDDAVIPITKDSSGIKRFLKSLDADVIRTEKIRKNGVIQSLLRHDWVYRWRDILELVGMKPDPKLEARENRLKELASLVEKS